MKMQTFEEIFIEEGIIPEWIERGVKQGMEKTTLEIARKMKAKGHPFTEIAEITDLSVEAVEQL